MSTEMPSGQWVVNFRLIHRHWVDIGLLGCKNGWISKDEQHPQRVKQKGSLKAAWVRLCHHYSDCDNLIKWEKKGHLHSLWKPVLTVEADPVTEMGYPVHKIALWTASSRDISEQEANCMHIIYLLHLPRFSFGILKHISKSDNFVHQIIICALISNLVLKAWLEKHESDS